MTEKQENSKYSIYEEGESQFPFIQVTMGIKFAVEALSESVKYELEPFGISTHTY